MGLLIDADMVLLGANIVTMDGKHPTAEALGIKDGKFLWIGKNSEAKEVIGEKTQVKQMKGSTIFPGFIESHNHTLQFGLDLNGVNLGKVRGIEELLDLVGDEIKSCERGGWIVGTGYNQDEFEEKRHPNRWDLDRLGSDNPVCLKHTSGHAMVVNSKALEFAGINKDTQSPEGGRIVKDHVSGEPTGQLFAFSAMRLIKDIMPMPSFNDLINGLKNANDVLLSEGITSATDAGVGWVQAPRQIGAYQEAVEKNILKIRHSLTIWGESVFDYNNADEELARIEWGLLGMGIRSGLGNDKLKIGPFKFVPDGAISTGTASTYEPYGATPNMRSQGELMIEPDVMKKVVEKVYGLGWQLAIHGIGDRAIDVGIDAIENAMKINPGMNSRPRMEHCTMVNDKTIKRMKDLGIIAVLQPAFLWQLGDNWITQLGLEKARKLKPFKSFLDHGVMIVFSSDRPVVHGAPLLGIHTAVNEKTMNGQDYCPEQKISVEESLKAYTTNGAYTSFDEDLKGSISTGKFADLVVLEENPISIAPERIKDIKIEATMIEGEFVYQNK